MLIKYKIMSVVILSIYPEIYSTKIAVSEDENVVYQSDVNHSKEDFILFESVMEQMPFRRDAIMDQMRKDNVDIKSIQYVVAEGGLLRPCGEGVYLIDKTMVGDLIEGIGGDDIINIGGLLAFTIANTLRIKSFVVTPASLEERSDLAAFSPHPSIRKKSLFHAMINKYLSRQYAQSVKKNYENMNIIFCHVSDRNVSVAAHHKGRVVDVNQAYQGFGPMGFYEPGTVPVSDMIDMLFKKHYSKDEMLKLLNRNATFFSYAGTNSCDEIINSIQNKNTKTKHIIEAMAYQISKEISSHYVTLEGKIDAIILSGKIFSSNCFFKYLSKRIESLAPIVSYPKDYTFEAMIYNVLQVVNDDVEIKSYR